MTSGSLEDRYGATIILAGFILIMIVVAMFLYLGLIVGAAFGCEGNCSEMFLGDNWTLGYVEEIAKQCQK